MCRRICIDENIYSIHTYTYGTVVCFRLLVPKLRECGSVIMLISLELGYRQDVDLRTRGTPTAYRKVMEGCRVMKGVWLWLVMEGCWVVKDVWLWKVSGNAK